uniref:Rx N-terminal domain-containing protein n=1 Tax=Oryza brachyantha TaxID=4533 RepID=J3N074_ORYBR
MELVVGASESTVKSLLGKLGGLLAQEYSLIRGVEGDLHFINDELTSMQAFLRQLGETGGGRVDDHRVRDWMKQIRDITYDIEDCVDDSANRIHGLSRDVCCYFLSNSVYEVLTWWPRRDVAAKIASLKMRAQQIGERRQRYGVENPKTPDPADGSDKPPASSRKAGFDAASNQDPSLELVVTKEPVGLNKYMDDALKNWIADKDKAGVLAIVGYGGVGKTSLANSLYREFGDQFDQRAMITVSQTSDVDAILKNIKDQVTSHNNQEQQGGHSDNRLLKGLRGVMASQTHAQCMGEATWTKIRNSLPEKGSKVIVTTRFQAVATTCARDPNSDHSREVKPLDLNESKQLFTQAFDESKGTKEVENILENVWKMCGGLPLAIVTVAGLVACNPDKLPLNICSSLFPESTRDAKKEVNQEEVARIISHCYNDMPAEIKTCSLYLSIFPKGHRIGRKRLTRRWIAEGFVFEKDGMSVEEVAETYFNHLIRRKIVRAVKHSSSGKVKHCVVHDMILEHIVAKAAEENFITVVGGHWFMQPASSKVRRLSLQGSDAKRSKDTEKMNLTHVRSLTMFDNLNQLPSHSFRFGIVQVLDLEGCKGFRKQHTKEICEMVLLKYLSLRGTDAKKLHNTIKNLLKLETLDVRETKIVELPKAICNLERLVNIFGGNKITRQALKLPDELMKRTKMRAMRVLSGVEIAGEAGVLHHLTELRKLAIYKLNIKSDMALKDLLSSIWYLGGYSLHTLLIEDESPELLQLMSSLPSPPKFLTALELSAKIVKLPDWIAQLDVLNKLTLSVTALRTDNLEDLSKLKALFSLTFSLAPSKQDPETVTMIQGNRAYPKADIIIPAGGFEKLKLLRFSAPFLPLLTFSRKAMEHLQRLELRFSMLEGLHGVEFLESLKEVHLSLRMKKQDHPEINEKAAEHIKKWIEDDITGSNGSSKAKIIFDQYYEGL